MSKLARKYSKEFESYNELKFQVAEKYVRTHKTSFELFRLLKFIKSQHDICLFIHFPPKIDYV